MDRPLSNTDIEQLLKGRTRVIKYQELFNFPNIESVLHPYGNAVILYPGAGEVGHWTCVLYTTDDRGKKIIEFFDPYGIEIDREFHVGRGVPQLPRILSAFLYDTKFPVEFNDNRLQKFAASINTCGRHCVNRINHSHLPLSLYAKEFGRQKKGGSTPDQIVTRLTGGRLPRWRQNTRRRPPIRAGRLAPLRRPRIRLPRARR